MRDSDAERDDCETWGDAVGVSDDDCDERVRGWVSVAANVRVDDAVPVRDRDSVLLWLTLPDTDERDTSSESVSVAVSEEDSDGLADGDGDSDTEDRDAIHE